MRKKAIVVAAVKPTPFKQTKQFLTNVTDFMYGTQKRARFTVLFATAVALSGALMSVVAHCCACSLH